MSTASHSTRRVTIAALVAGVVLQLGFLNSCNDRFIGFTRIFDPCGTILANCTPGSFQANTAPIGDGCVDPTCTVPGLCDPATPPLGTVRDICD